MRNEGQNVEQQVVSNKEQAQEYDSFLYKFQQQIIDAWKPVPHTSSNVILYIILSAICIGLGLGLILSAPTSQEVYVRYDTSCTPSSTNNDTEYATSPCKITFTLTNTLTAPVYVYYGFKGFYQNHRRYLKYFSTDQLSSGNPDQSTAKSDCGTYYTNADTFGSNLTSLGGAALVPSDPAFPCGTIARMYYKLRAEIQGFRMFGPASSTEIPITQNGIAWPSDIGRHKNANDNKTLFRVTEQTWLVWFRPAARSDFYKLNGIINQDLAPGTYTVTIKNQVSPTWGEKWFSISKSNYVGTRDLFLGIAFLALGGGCFILLIVFLAKWIAQKRDKQKFT